MQLKNCEMDQLREQLALNGLPVTNACLEVKVIPDSQSTANADSSPTRKLQLDKNDLQNVFQAYGLINEITIQD